MKNTKRGLNNNRNKMETTVNGENIDHSIESDEIDDQIAQRKADRKRLKCELKILQKRRRRWSKIDLGLLQTVLMTCFKNVTRKTSLILTIVLNILFSLFDIASDFYVAITLFSNGEWKYGVFVILLDYLPGWELVLHNLSSQKWRNVANVKERRIMILFLIISPFSLPLFYIHWLVAFNKSDDVTFEFLHHNARLSQLLVGSVESPLQIMMLFILWSEGKLTPPWTENFVITDLIGRKIDFDIVPGILSLGMSVTVVLKSSLEIAETRSKGENLAVCGYAFCNFAFRLGSFSLAIIYFREWSIILFGIIAFVNVVSIIQYDSSERRSYSIITSALISMFAPFISSDQPHEFQKISASKSIETLERNARHRRNLSSYMALLTTPLILMCDAILYCLLKYYPEFEYSDETVLCKDSSEAILLMLIFPGGISATLAALSFRKTVHPEAESYFSTNQVLNFIMGTIIRGVTSCLRCIGILLAVIVLVCGCAITLSTLPTCPNGKLNNLKAFGMIYLPVVEKHVIS